MLSHSISSRLKRYVDPNAPKSGSRASARPVAVSEVSSSSLAGPRYPVASGSGAQQQQHSPQQEPSSAPLRFSEKTLPPGAAAPPPPPAQFAGANAEYEEIQRAVAKSREEQEYKAAVEQSQTEEEAEAARRNKEIQAEQALLQASRAEQERLEDERAIAQAEEEQEVLRAIRESEALARSIREGKRRAVTQDGDEEDPDVQRVLQLSIQENQDDQRRQHEELERRRVGPNSPGGSSSFRTAQSSRYPEEDDESILLRGDAPPAYEPPSDEKRLVFYPPIANNDMTEGSMRAFVPHMLFAARARGPRRASDENMPMASRDVDLKTLPASMHSSFSSKAPAPNLLPPPLPKRTRRPLPPLPNQQTSLPKPPQKAAGGLEYPPLPKRRPPPIPARPTSSAMSYGFPRAASPASIGDNSFIQERDTDQASVEYVREDNSTTCAEEDVHSTHALSQDYDDPHAETQSTEATRERDFYYRDRSQANRASGYDYAPDVASAMVEPENWRPHEQQSSRYGPSDETHTTYQSASEAVPREEDPSPATSEVRRHDYTRAVSSTTGLPGAVSPEPMAAQEDNGEYDTDHSAISWESTASEGGDSPPPEQIPETSHDINTNISFGFNPLSSPTKALDWQGRFPDVVVLSRSADRSGGESTVGAKEDYRTFAFEAPTWRELLAYLMWHGNSIFQVSPSDLMPRTTQQVSLILEFVKTERPPSTLVRLQIHLLGPGPAAGTLSPGPASPALPGVSSPTGESGARGVALSRKPLSSRPTNYVQSSTPWNQADTRSATTHLVLAFPKPYQTLPCTLSTIGQRLNSAQKTATVLRTQRASGGGSSAASNSPQDTFLLDLLRGIDMCTDSSASVVSPSRPGASPPAAAMDDSRFDRLIGRLKSQRQKVLKGTFRDLHRSTKKSSRKSKYVKGDAKRQDSGSGESHLESTPADADFHITPFTEDQL